jgi:hypothetical protein
MFWADERCCLREYWDSNWFPPLLLLLSWPSSETSEETNGFFFSSFISNSAFELLFYRQYCCSLPLILLLGIKN